VAAGYTLTLRREGATEKQHHPDLATAIDALEQEGRAFATTERRAAQQAFLREYEPVQIVALRAELSGRGVRAGVDVRGDGSAEAYTGRLSRSLVEQRGGESPYDALRRVLGVSPGR
jgi:hypothetical protein